MRNVTLTALLVATVTLVGCTRATVVTALQDAQWGLAAGCASTWVPAADCQVATDGLDAAIKVAQQAPASEVKPAVLKSLVSTEALLPAGSRAVDYWTYLTAFLA